MAARWRQLGHSVQGHLVLPKDSGYRQARLTENPRYDGSRPLAVLAVASAQDIARAFTFAQDNEIPIQMRSGGHSYTGWSSGGGGGTGQPAALVLDCRGLNAVKLSGGSATIGSGAPLAGVYQAIGSAGRAIPGGSCATVGIAGLTQGGGVGVLTRALGLTCDSVKSMQVVLADGSVVTASADEHDDLFWALRGGGGGHLGMVTSFDFDTVAAPTVNTFYLQWPIAAATQVIPAWQDWIDGADPKLWSTLKGLGGSTHGSGAILACAGTWIGSSSGLGGQLGKLLAHTPRPAVNSTHTKSYLDAMRSYAGCASLPASQCHTGPGGGLQREAFAATSHVGYHPLDAKGVRTIVQQVKAAPGSLIEAGLSMDALGGKVAEVAPDETAFVHRKARITVQYTATYDASGAAATAADYVHGFRKAMTPSWGTAAYVNYIDSTISDYRSAYWGDNAPRLAKVRQAYDPHRFFTQPQDY
jgi:FAD/FMN-containing dehydrogenase